jgi:hypothetical protein
MRTTRIMRVCCDRFTLQVLVEKLAGSCDLTDRYRAYRTSSTHSVCFIFCSCAGVWGSLLVAATSLTGKGAARTRQCALDLLLPLQLGVREGAWTWKDGEATLVPEVCSR